MRIDIATRDGLAPSYVFRPEGQGNGPWPGVLVFMDGIGIRPAMLEIGERLATYGDFVLLPDLYYRSGPYTPMSAQTAFADPEQRKILTERRSEEHTSELQSRLHLVCRLLLEKKKKTKQVDTVTIKIKRIRQRETRSDV